MSLVNKGFIQRVLVFALLSCSLSATALAQDKITRTPSVSTNLIDWMLVVPNVGVEIPLSHPQYVNGSSLYLEGKASLNANRMYAPDMNYRLFSGKAEFRRHFRFGEQTHYTINGEYTTEEGDVVYLNILDSLSWMIRATNKVAGAVSTKKFWDKRRVNYVDDLGRSYVGVFAQYADYSMCLPLFDYSRGRKGEAAIVGLSLGYQKPFHNFSNRFYLEWEMGGSLGCVVTEFDKYNRVESEVTGQGKWFYPLITDLHVSLVLRRHSVKDLYAKKKQVSDFKPAQIERIMEKQEKAVAVQQEKQEKAAAKEQADAACKVAKEEKKELKRLAKEQAKAEKEQAKVAKEQEKEAKKLAKQQAKEAKQLAKEQEKLEKQQQETEGK
ncbi:MAG: DUF3575 domain-containing protein [Bacteroidaceae bacterium]|nr:DUF3575 domain-containing protein [Bacteroidaceae bacterium]